MVSADKGETTINTKYNAVKCPYWECRGCGKEFVVEIEFIPTFTAEKIEYITCGVCGNESRELYSHRNKFPFPEKLKDKGNICHKCYLKGMYEVMEG